MYRPGEDYFEDDVTPEEKAIIRFYPDLVSSILPQVEAVADQCLTNNVIAKEQYKSIITESVDHGNRSRKVLQSVRDSVKGNRDKFQSFLRVIKDEQIVSDIRNHYN